ncbi:unnamed protein product [Pseudo-nitzschia multistriata]|uniref:Leucine-rich repeat-containing N-terminal plant-type domain-containing protein n=1 Tax=Pseudo-nitzschia multistriata TaxID=183589 RepID=A0A448ZD13_9STRA|nr:unnamed protein product [Pseudo-nitzschia multistriata]
MLDAGSKEAFAPVEFDEKTIEDQFSDEIDNDGNLFGETDDAALVVRVPYDANDGDGGHNHPASGSNNTRKYRPGRWRWRCWGLVLVALSIGVLVSAGMLWQGSRKHRLDDDSILDRKSHDPSASSIIHSAAENSNYGQNGIDMDERNSHSYTNKHPLDPWLFSGEGNHDTPNNHNTPNNHDSPTTYERGVESRLERERHFANLAVQWSDGVALSWKHSPARMALDWILDDDPMHLPTYGDRFVFQQRYIAAVFYFATRGQQQTAHEDLHDDSSSSGGSEDSAPFLANTDVCLWANSNGKSGIFCDDEGNIVKLNFRDFGLAGTLPRELGFLSGLTSINLEGNDISGTVPSHYGLLVNLERMGLGTYDGR